MTNIRLLLPGCFREPGRLFSRLIGAFMLIIKLGQASGQDIQFSQFYTASLYLNPAFAGSTHYKGRAMFQQRIQWPALQAKYITSLVAYDIYSVKYRSGASVMLIRDYQGKNTISSTELQFQYAYELPVTHNLTLRMGLQAGYVWRYLDYAHLRYPEQFNDQGYTGAPSPNDGGNPRKSYLDLSSGAILYSKGFWVGFSGHHINQPNQSFLGEVSRLPVKYTLVTGYKIFLDGQGYHRRDSEEEISIVPTANYKFQGKSDQFDIGIYGRYNNVIGGFWYRGIPIKRYMKGLQNNESVVLLTGYKYHNWTFTYSYDFTVSRLAPARTFGSHELNITYVRSKRYKKKKPTRRLPCPEFY